LVNYRGAPDTITCLAGLAELDWPQDRLELIVVDNDSGDGSAESIRAASPGATVVESGANLGFAGGCNLGVEHATGEYVAFLNNDARPD
ncbi:MAG TPA: glycosyltransferase, partial [Actinotalea sp.]|nr:glycosyltransferase [Actinotalea sp.]